MSIINGASIGQVDDFERLKLVATLATMIYAAAGFDDTPIMAVARARAVLSAADDSLAQNPDLRLADEAEVK